MGFYAPAQIVGDAKNHGVVIRPIDINYSLWDNILEVEDSERSCRKKSKSILRITSWFQTDKRNT